MVATTINLMMDFISYLIVIDVITDRIESLQKVFGFRMRHFNSVEAEEKRMKIDLPNVGCAFLIRLKELIKSWLFQYCFIFEFL